MPEQTSISVRYTNELKDHIEAQRILYGRSFTAKVDKAVAVLLVGCGAYTVAVAGPHWWTIIWFPLAAAEWFNLLSPARWRTVIAFKRSPRLRTEYHLTFSPGGIHFTTVTIDSMLKWGIYQSFVESPDLFLLMYDKVQYTLVPRRCFRSDEEIAAFRTLLQQNIKSTRG